MAITTYAELKTAVANWLNRSNLTSRIPEFISLGEAMLWRDLRIKEIEKRVTASISTEFFDIPTNFIEMRNIEIATDPLRKLDYMPPEQIDVFYPTNTTGKPKVYSIHGEEFQVKPIPDASYTVNMTYWYRLTAFSADNDTNNLLTRYPGLYLYSSLVAATPYVDDEEDKQTWMTLYENEVNSLNKKDKQGRYSGTSLQARPDFIPE